MYYLSVIQCQYQSDNEMLILTLCTFLVVPSLDSLSLPMSPSTIPPSCRQLILDGQWDEVLQFIQPLECMDKFDRKR